MMDNKDLLLIMDKEKRNSKDGGIEGMIKKRRLNYSRKLQIVS